MRLTNRLLTLYNGLKAHISNKPPPLSQREDFSAIHYHLDYKKQDARVVKFMADRVKILNLAFKAAGVVLLLLNIAIASFFHFERKEVCDCNTNPNATTNNPVASDKTKEEPKQEVKEDPRQEAKEEPKQEVKEDSKQEAKEEPKQEAKEEPKQEVKEDPKQEAKEEPKQEVKEDPKQEAKEESKQEVKEESREGENKQDLCKDVVATTAKSYPPSHNWNPFSGSEASIECVKQPKTINKSIDEFVNGFIPDFLK